MIEGIVIVFIIMLARFPVIFISTAKENFSAKEKLFISWLGPRGIIALSVASIAAIKLEASGMEKAYTIEILIFMLISITVLMQGLSAKWVAHKLNILVKGDRSLIILGVNEISLMIAEKWRNDRTDILFIDSNSKNCRMARQKGFLCIEGNALDSATYRGFEMDNYTSALAASYNNEINIIFCRFLKETYGTENLYTVLNDKANEELSEIIKEENIKLAFGTRSKDEENFSWDGFLSRIKDVFSIDKQGLKWFQITCDEFVKNSAGKYPLPKGVTIFLVVRNGTDRYIYHTSFELKLNDEIYAMASQEGMERMQSLLCGADDKESGETEE
jgi:Trk K+ transport system NAD-binding subunit